MNSIDPVKRFVKITLDVFGQGRDKERNETMNNIHCTHSVLKLDKSTQEAFGHYWKMTILLIALIFPTLLFLSLGYMGRDALKSRIAEKANITVFFKPGVTPEKAAIERLRTSSPWTITNLELIPPTSVVDLVTKRTDTNTSMLIKDVSPEAFPFALIVGVDSEHLGEVSELVTSLNVHLKEIQEIRYPAAAIKEALRDLQRIDTFLLFLTIMMVLVAIGGCLSVLSIAAKSRWYSWEYNFFSSFVAVSLSAFLLFITGELIGDIANWHFSFPTELYESIMAIAALASLLGYIFNDAKTKLVDTTVHKGDEVDGAPEVQEG